MLRASTHSYASSRDMHPVEGDVTYYGVLTDIVELYYSHDCKYVLFKCDWVDNNRGLVERDDFGFTLVNFRNLLYTKGLISDEPFILASQAQQVFYVQDPIEEDWKIVIKVKPRDLFEVYGQQPREDARMQHNQVEEYGQQDLDETAIDHDDDDMVWVRQGVVGTTVHGYDDE